jgi:hypothetical protein
MECQIAADEDTAFCKIQLRIKMEIEEEFQF